jgi:hypothetical protein
MTSDEYEKWLGTRVAECGTYAENLDGNARIVFLGKALAYRIALYHLPKVFESTGGASPSEFASLRDTARALSERQSILVRERDEALSIIQHERKFAAGLTSDIKIERDQALQQVDEVSKVRDDLSVELTKAEAELTHLRISGSDTKERLEKLFRDIVESKIGLPGVLQGIGRILGKEEP